jgi:hypothetical protein
LPSISRSSTMGINSTPRETEPHRFVLDPAPASVSTGNPLT